MLKLSIIFGIHFHLPQPPSGGCVLKRIICRFVNFSQNPAAFGRLCVETCMHFWHCIHLCQPPSGGCVLKHKTQKPFEKMRYPAAFGRLCVETVISATACCVSPYPAAFGRLCVETCLSAKQKPGRFPSRLRAAVC